MLTELPPAAQPSNVTHAMRQNASGMLFTMSLFDRLSTPLFLVTRRSILVWANSSCRRFLAESHQLTMQGDRVRAGSRHQHSALEAFLEGRGGRAPHVQPDVFVLERPSGEGGTLLVRLTEPFSLREGRWDLALGGSEGGAQAENQIVGIIDPKTLTARPNIFARALYNLTEAEHELCVALAAGRCLKDCARLRGVTINTVRAQLKSVLAKMSITRQQDLVRVWLSLSVIDSSTTAVSLGGISARHALGA